MANTKYIEIDFENLKHFFTGDLILLVTATDLETSATHTKLKPFWGYDKIIKVFEGDLTYYFGMLGNYKIVHVQCTMGSLSRGSSIMTVRSAIEKLQLKIVIMVGIAFGIDETKQNIGDVLISESVIPYNPKRIGKRHTINKGIEVPSSKILLNRFKNIKQTWEFPLSNHEMAKLIPTRLLSGEELVDNITYRNKLIKTYSDSLGGEMEGSGVSAACDGKADWIIVKGICDFADGDKAKDKETRQNTAIHSALSVCLEVFNSNSAFKELRIMPFLNPQNDVLKPDLNVNNVLFDIYDFSKEDYYIERSQDKDFNQTVKQFGIWLSGPAGCGKSNLILRNIIKNKYEFITISLAACVGMTVDSFFKEVLYDIASKLEGDRYQVQSTSFRECVNEIFNLLVKKVGNKELIIFIEEIPISSDKEYEDFANRFFSIIIQKNLTADLDKMKFVLSSIKSPTNHIKNFQQKIHQHLKFITLEYWQEEDILLLLNVIEKTIQFSLPYDIKEYLTATALGSPRFIKKFFRSVYSIGKTDEETLKFIIKETERDLSQYKNV